MNPLKSAQNAFFQKLLSSKQTWLDTCANTQCKSRLYNKFFLKHCNFLSVLVDLVFKLFLKINYQIFLGCWGDQFCSFDRYNIWKEAVVGHMLHLRCCSKLKTKNIIQPMNYRNFTKKMWWNRKLLKDIFLKFYNKLALNRFTVVWL